MSNALLLNIREIAKWPNEQMSVPALQRGLVWNPKQIELFWDSIMRGIPVGSFVVCNNVKTQHRSVVRSEYHLLDGQQRANAISLGFDDYNDPQNPKKSILWLDINPDKMPQDSSRNYLFRITTQAHPWGYNKSDNEGFIGTAAIRSFLERFDIDVTDKEYSRPAPKDLYPQDANCPIPMSILFSSFKNDKIDKDLLVNILENIRKDSKTKKALNSWVTKALDSLVNCNIDLSKIERGLINANKCEILALQTPDELLESSNQENNFNQEQENITNIEHLFQRLNQKGTRLDGEELIYSLIKAYWPEIANKIDELAKFRMPCSRLINLAFRVILSEESNSIAPSMTVSAIRRLAKDDKKRDLRNKIINFINNDLENCCKQVDAILGVNPQYSWGLPPVLYREIARNHAELYLLMLLWAKKFSVTDNEEMCKRLTGIITYAAWFGKDQSRIVQILYKNTINDFSNSKLVDSVVEEAATYFHKLHCPQAYNDFIQLLDNEELAKWDWWNLIANSDESLQRQNDAQWWGGLCTIRNNKRLLLYAQRKFIRVRFKDYDPSRKDLWEEHNRPWDYDHILPHVYVYNKKSNNAYMSFCQKWCNTIGNYRVWPAEDNRSDQATPANNKITGEELLTNSYIINEEMIGFSQERNVISEKESALQFANACKSRMLRIYEEWYDSLKIEDLLSKKQHK